jgi:hypothetical protein
VTSGSSKSNEAKYGSKRVVEAVHCMLMQMADIELIISGAGKIPKTSVSVTTVDLEVHASHLDS